MQQQEMIVCFCEECLEEFHSFIAKDICPICSKISKDDLIKPKYETFKKTRRYEE